MTPSRRSLTLDRGECMRALNAKPSAISTRPFSVAHVFLPFIAAWRVNRFDMFFKSLFRSIRIVEVLTDSTGKIKTTPEKTKVRH